MIISLYFSGCRAKSFWFLGRHGSRNPSGDEISQMEIRGPEIQAAIVDNHQNDKGTRRYQYTVNALILFALKVPLHCTLYLLHNYIPYVTKTVFF